MTVSAGGVMGALSGFVFRACAVHQHLAYDSERCGILWLLFEDVRGAVGVNLVGAAQARQTGA